MENIDYKALDKIINAYKKSFKEIRNDEIYKWEAVKTFQDNWDINAENFVEMLKKSLSKSNNLLDSFMYFPKRMVIQFAEKETSMVKDMFNVLFDENRQLKERYNYFVSKSEEILKKYWEEGKNHYQDTHTISVYLTFMYPDKYYMYKSSVDNKVAKELNANIYNRDRTIQLNNYYELCNKILEYIKDDTDLIKLHNRSLNENCYKDEQLHILTWDLLFYGGTSYRENKIKEEVSINGEKYFWLNANPKIWSFSELKIGETIEYTAINENGNKRRIYKNYEDAKKGDKVIAYESTPTKAIVGICEVDKELRNNVLKIRKVETLINPVDYREIINNEDLKNMEFFQNSQGSLFKLEKSEYDSLMDMIRENNPLVKKVADKYIKKDFLQEVYISSEKYEEVKNLLLRKKNIILQGAPGVGKTYMAKRLAYSIMEEKEDDKIMCIQFHQSYSYEDFIEGYRPTENGFKLERGVFYNFCKKAENDPTNKYFFIIDEINRGNLSKIFGELLMLIENDKRNARLTLTYSKVSFSVPENVYIIGMMNTADRSLAIMDYALRRRFSFYNIEPAFENEKFKKYQETLNSEILNKTIEKIKRLNEVIEKDVSLGKGFKIGHSYFCNLNEKNIDETIESILKYEIIPLIEEYWFDDNTTFENWKKNLVGEQND